jgi:hypothetical protein
LRGEAGEESHAAIRVVLSGFSVGNGTSSSLILFLEGSPGFQYMTEGGDAIVIASSGSHTPSYEIQRAEVLTGQYP